MYDPKFEKEVQRKMEELEFSPSEAVWTNIERTVKKKRRRIPFFWLFTVSGALLLGAGAIIIRSGSRIPSSSTAGVLPPAAPVAASVTPEKTPGSPEKRPGSPDSRTPGLLPARPASGPAIVRSTAGGSGKQGLADKTTTTIEGTSTIINDPFVQPAKEADPVIAARHRESYMPGLESFFLPAPKITGADLALKKTTLAVQLPKPRHPWEAAFTGGIGISSLDRLHLGFGKSPSASGLAYASPGNSNSNYYMLTNPAVNAAGLNAKQPPSEIRPDLSFSAGIQARKPLSRQWTFTVGLDLLYYSTRMKVGQQVSAYSPTTGALLTSSAAAPIQNYPYYTTGEGQSFTNRYYFLEIPASLQWQLNHSRILPLFWEGGVSLSYLMSSDALYYDPNSGVYFKNGNVTNRAQVSLSTSLMMGLPLGGGARLQVGPQVQYGLTSLLQTEAGTQHLFYGGIRIVVIPGKSKK